MSHTELDDCIDERIAAEERAEAAEAERDTLRVKLDFEMAHSQRMMEERDRANAGFAALSKEYDKAMTRLAAHGEKVTA